MAMRTNLLLPEDLIAEVDHFAGSRGRSRYVAEALRAKVRQDRLREAAEQTFGAWKAADYPQFATPDMVVDWVRDRRAERTDVGGAK